MSKPSAVYKSDKRKAKDMAAAITMLAHPTSNPHRSAFIPQTDKASPLARTKS